jgi:hypothetical protein
MRPARILERIQVEAGKAGSAARLPVFGQIAGLSLILAVIFAAVASTERYVKRGFGPLRAGDRACI